MYHAAELVHWMRNQDSKILLPAQVDIDLTNQDCYYCNSIKNRIADILGKDPVREIKKAHLSQ